MICKMCIQNTFLFYFTQFKIKIFAINLLSGPAEVQFESNIQLQIYNGGGHIY